MSAEPDTGTGKAPLRVVIVTGIFPPDIGGPATHSADLVAELRARGHEAAVLSLTDAPRRTEHEHVVRFPRRWPWPARLVAVAAWLARNRRRFDVVYATGLHPAAVAGARLARKPVVVKVVGDPVWERGARLGLASEDFSRSEHEHGGPPRLRMMRLLRNWSVRTPNVLTVPSKNLESIVQPWLGERAVPLHVIPNGVRVAEPDTGPPAASIPLRLAFVGRLVGVKRVDALIEALSRVDGVHLDVIGDGPERERLEQVATRAAVANRVNFTGALDHEEVLEHVSSASALVMASSHEGLPHVVLESLALGVPVVTSGAGGIAEVITDELNGLVVDPPDVAGFAAAVARLRDDEALRTKLREGAQQAGARWSFDRCGDEIESMLRSLVARRPRIINLGKTWTDNPPGADLERKLEVLARHLDATIVSTGPVGVRRVAGVRLVGLPALRPRMLGGLAFYPVAALLAVTCAALQPGTAIVCQSPFEAASVLALRRLVPAKRRPRVVVEVHGDWRTASRLYGSGWRRVLAPAADRFAESSVRRADRVRVVGPAMQRLVRKAGYRGFIDCHVTYSDYDVFIGRENVPPPTEPRALFVGAFEPYKAPEVLIEAWRLVHDVLPGARLSLVGSGPMGARLRSQATELGLEDFVDFKGALSREQVAELLDASTCLVLPSRSEGMPRVAVEAMARARPVVGSTGGGIPDAVEDGETGRLVPPGQPAALAAALVEVLADPTLAARMGEEARCRAVARNPAREFEAGIARLAVWAART